MRELDEDQSHIKKYLLGELAEGDRQVIEERLMTDRDFSEKVLIVESELIEDYLDGILSEPDQSKFLKYILSTDKQAEKLKLAKALNRYTRVDAAANSPPEINPSPQPGPLKRGLSDLFRVKKQIIKFSAAAIIPIILIGATVIFYLVRDDAIEKLPPLKSIEQELEKLNSEQNPQSESVGFVIGPLRPGLLRGDGDINKFSIPENESVIQLRLQIGSGEYQSFQAVLQTSENEGLFTLRGLKDRTINGERLVTIYIPAILKPGDYQLRLSGLTQDDQLIYLGRYNFQILGKQ